MICPKCNGRGTVGYFHVDHFVDVECDRCNGSGEVSEVPMTNEEWIHQCNTEQLAEWIAKIVDCDCCPVKRKFCDDNPCKIRFAKWLKQPHGGE